MLSLKNCLKKKVYLLTGTVVRTLTRLSAFSTQSLTVCTEIPAVIKGFFN